MNLEELNDSKKYVIGGIVSSESDAIIFPHLIDEFFTETDIKSSINTEEAIIFFKYFLEKYLKTFTDDERKPFDKMVITLNTYFYMEEKIANTSDYEYKIKGVSFDDFLKDIVKIVPEVKLIMEEASVSYKLPYGTLREHKKNFVVNYNEFASRLGELGYELNYQNFEQLLNGELMQKPATFDVSLRLEDKKTR